MNKDKSLLAVYATDASGIKGKAAGIFSPTTIDEVQKIIASASLDIVPRGSGTNLMGGAVPNNSIVVEMRTMNAVTNVDTQKKTALVQAGVTVKELNEKLNFIGGEFPVSLNEQSTIGSMIAVNAVGHKSMRYGSMKEWIEEIEFVNGKGEIVKIGRADLSDVCGMEGTTGIICRARIKFVPKSQKSFSIFQTDTVSEIIALSRRLKAEPNVVMLKLYSKKASQIVGLPEKYNLIIGFDSERGKIKDSDSGKIYSFLKDESAFLYAHGYSESEDAKLFYDKIPEYISVVEEFDIPFVADMGLAIINPFFKKEESIKLNKIKEINAKMGVKKGRYPIGLKRKYLVDPLDKKIFMRIKKRHDPQGKMNARKLFDDFVPESIKQTLEKEEIILQKEETIIQKMTPVANISSSESEHKNPLSVPPRQLDAQEYNTIKNIMTNNKKEISPVWPLPQALPEKNKTESKSELDLIKKIMTNQARPVTDTKEDKKNGD